jgi:hypothetical protein
LISGSYSRAWGGGGAPDCNGDIVENCLKVGVRGEAVKLARVAARGARRARDWRAGGSRRFLVAVRTPRLIADMINWFQRRDLERERIESFSTIKIKQYLYLLAQRAFPSLQPRLRTAMLRSHDPDGVSLFSAYEKKLRLTF